MSNDSKKNTVQKIIPGICPTAVGENALNDINDIKEEKASPVELLREMD